MRRSSTSCAGASKPNDLFITMGAGDVHEIGEALVQGGTA